LIILATDFHESFNFTIDSVKELCSILPRCKSPFFMITAFRLILSLKHHLLPLFDDPAIVSGILELAVTTSDSRVALESLHFVLTLRKHIPTIADTVAGFDGRFRFSPAALSSAVGPALELFPAGVAVFVDSLFERPERCRLNGAVVRALRRLDQENLGQAVEEHRLVPRIIAAYDHIRPNWHLTWLAEGILEGLPQIAVPEWLTFIKEKLQPRIRLRDGGYGGPLPRSCFSSFEDYVSPADLVADDYSEYADAEEEDAAGVGPEQEESSYDCPDYDDEPIESPTEVIEQPAAAGVQ
jgi:hypothetical protein